MSRFTVLLAACLLTGACGANSTTTSSATTRGTRVFAQNCHSCHSLVGDESEHKQGGDLLGYHMSRAQLLGFTREMPTRRLSPAQLDAVVNYILAVQSKSRS